MKIIIQILSFYDLNLMPPLFRVSFCIIISLSFGLSICHETAPLWYIAFAISAESVMRIFLTMRAVDLLNSLSIVFSICPKRMFMITFRLLWAGFYHWYTERLDLNDKRSSRLLFIQRIQKFCTDRLRMGNVGAILAHLYARLVFAMEIAAAGDK